jgi:DNA-binding GntR family transcriptional regulator
MASTGSDDSLPASLQVAAALRDEIAAGTLTPGDKLPSIRTLAERFSVAPMTAQNAIEALRNEGLIFTSPGRGSFVRDQATQAGSSTPSPEYLAITEHLEEIDTQVREMADRVSELERLVRNEHQAGH